MTAPRPQTTVFEQAAAHFPGWTDPESGLRVLRVWTRGPDEKKPVWSTPYHQHPCFLDGGRRVLLNGASPKGKGTGLLDLTTGKVEDPFPEGVVATEVNDQTKVALAYKAGGKHRRVCLWDINAQREIAGLETDDSWTAVSGNLVSDGRRAVVFQHRGRPYGENVDSRYMLIEQGKEPRKILDIPGHFCSHFQSCPNDPELFAYDCWPSPARPIQQTIHIRTMDGKFNEPLKLLPDTIRSPDMWGARDHYLWTPDARWIVSYLFPHPQPEQKDFNHFQFEWWLSATDWRTGEDRAAKYPPNRWGGHMGVSPDSRQIICGGGPGYDKLFLVSIDGLKHGWNERLLCNYPPSRSTGKNSDPFPYPFALPDQSGVIFNAGWPGPDHGVYLAQWPKGV